jgi:ketosteroid isomerase-like protein
MSSDILTLREAYDVFDKTRIPAFDLLALDVVWSIKDGHRDDVFRGLEGVSSFAGNLRALFDEFRIELEEIEDIGEGWFLVVVRQRTRARMGGTETDERQFHLCRLQGGKVARLDVYFTRERALEAIAVVHDG